MGGPMTTLEVGLLGGGWAQVLQRMRAVTLSQPIQEQTLLVPDPPAHELRSAVSAPFASTTHPGLVILPGVQDSFKYTTHTALGGRPFDQPLAGHSTPDRLLIGRIELARR
ncbi:uncharacterized protein N7482_009494 [Penicillium canariense]|uniref:Uncharacterized protein n=1 Tax=Penicillium canariense TaxID=189055 RepID=A0A9W9HRC4_9EURO|nr:uncharacterized protein N7482_009494 [Penicillium canariense]KAJ5153016.1 hypothetical protein N7482_009494 [Penicillium canariense]